MYIFKQVESDTFGYQKRFIYQRPYGCNFLTRRFLGAAIDKEKNMCVFIDENSDKEKNEYTFIPNYSISICKIEDGGKCTEITSEPLWSKSLNEVLNFINSKY